HRPLRMGERLRQRGAPLSVGVGAVPRAGERERRRVGDVGVRLLERGEERRDDIGGRGARSDGAVRLGPLRRLGGRREERILVVLPPEFPALEALAAVALRHAAGAAADASRPAPPTPRPPPPPHPPSPPPRPP